MTLLQFVQGPLWYFASAVFVLGVLWRLIAMVMIGKPRDLSAARTSSFGGGIKAILLHSVPHGGNLARTIYHFLVGYAFHIGLFVLVLFAAPHVRFIEERLLGWAWTPVPGWGFALAAQFAFAGLILLYIRRLTDPVMRKLSDWDDHIGTWLVFLVMLTGCLALQESHDGLRLIHLLSVEALMIYFPFSRLMHAFTFAFSRYNTGATYGRRGVTP
ncbi:MAG: respiratory nitrate reductase subunit gamma [Nitratireductor sp.]|nr:respiratory nitrate reductase subunit gamma [Nitratireductor sp.]